MSMAFAFSRWLLLVPLCIGIVLLVPPQVYAERRLRGQFQGSFLAFFPHFFEGVYPHGNFSWHHLWFLGHLFLYSLLALPLFRYWQHPAGKRQLARIARIAGGHFGLLWLALPLILERHLLWSIFPERHMLTSDWSNHALLFVAYLYGFVLAGTPWLGRVIDATWPSAAVFAGVTSASLVSAVWMGAVPSDIPPAYSAQYLAFWSVYAITAWTWLVARSSVLGGGSFTATFGGYNTVGGRIRYTCCTSRSLLVSPISSFNGTSVSGRRLESSSSQPASQHGSRVDCYFAFSVLRRGSTFARRSDLGDRITPSLRPWRRCDTAAWYSLERNRAQ